MTVDRDKPLEWFFRNRHAELPLFLMTMVSTERADYPSAQGQELLRQHFLYWWELEERGLLIGAGPVDVGTPQQGGFVILRASSREEADRLAADEPFSKAGWRVNTIRPWQLNEGLAVTWARELPAVAE